MSTHSFLHINTPSTGPASPNSSLGSDERQAIVDPSQRSSVYFPSTGKHKDLLVEDPGIHALPEVPSSSREQEAREGGGGREARQTPDLPEEQHENEAVHDATGPGPHQLPSVASSPEPPNEKEDDDSSSGSGSFKRKKRWLIALILIISAVLAIVAIVLGAVFGTRAAHSHDASSNSAAAATAATSATMSSSATSSATPSATQSSAPPQVNSTRGAWNKTGLGLMPTTQMIGDYYQMYLGYQSYSGQVEMVTLNFSSLLLNQSFNQVKNPVQIINSPWPLALNASMGTNLAGLTVPPGTVPGSSGTHLAVYSAPNGTLGDAWSPGPDNLTGWVFGPLMAQKLQVPTDGRPALLAQWAPCFGKSVKYANGSYSWGSGGMRLWAGGDDGRIHQYSYDLDSAEWATGDVVLADSWAYGGIAMAQLSPNVNCLDRQVLLSTARNGSIIYYTVPSYPGNNDTLWPAGEPWSGPYLLPDAPTFAPNSSIVTGPPARTNLTTDDELMLFVPGNDGVLQSIQINVDTLYTGGNASYKPVPVENVTVLPGSSLQVASFLLPESVGSSTAKGVNLMIYQNNGTSIDWAVLSGSEMQVLGNILA